MAVSTTIQLALYAEAADDAAVALLVRKAAKALEFIGTIAGYAYEPWRREINSHLIFLMLVPKGHWIDAARSVYNMAGGWDVGFEELLNEEDRTFPEWHEKRARGDILIAPGVWACGLAFKYSSDVPPAFQHGDAIRIVAERVPGDCEYVGWEGYVSDREYVDEHGEWHYSVMVKPRNEDIGSYRCTNCFKWEIEPLGYKSEDYRPMTTRTLVDDEFGGYRVDYNWGDITVSQSGVVMDRDQAPGST